MFKSLRALRGGCLIGAVLILALLFGGCAEDKTDIVESALPYLLFCPGGVNTCYQDCGTNFDIDGSGVIEPVEEPDYKTCTGYCDVNCSLMFLLQL